MVALDLQTDKHKCELFNRSGDDGGSEEGTRSGKSKLEALTEDAKLGNVTAVVGKVISR